MMEDPSVQPETPSTGDQSTLKHPANQPVRPYSELEITAKRPAVRLPEPGLSTGELAAISASAITTEASGDGAQGRRIVRSAGIIMVGQLLSSVMGMARIEVINIL